MFRTALLRISSVGGLVSAAAIVRSRQEEDPQVPSTASGFQPAWRQNSTFHRDVKNVHFDPASSTSGPGLAEASQDLNEDGRVDILDNVEVVEISEALKPNEQSKQQQKAEKLKAAISKARNLVWCKMYESGAPGLTIAVSVNGKTVWHHGFG